MPLIIQKIVKFPPDALRTVFNALYAQLDNFDSKAMEGGKREIRVMDDTSVDTILETSYRKRALSYAHGAILALHYLIPDPTLRMELMNGVIAQYNAFEQGGTFNLETLQHLLHQLIELFKANQLHYSDIVAGEKVANLERERPVALVSKYGDSEIVETPLEAQLEHRAFAAQFLTLTGAEKKQLLEKRVIKIPPTAPQWFKDLSEKNRVVQAYLIDHVRDGNLPTLSPALRGMPGMANMSVHHGQFVGHWAVDGKPQTRRVVNRVIRHGTLTPYEMMNHDEREAACQANGIVLAELIKKEAVEHYRDFWADPGKPGPIPVADVGLVSPLQGEGQKGVFARFMNRSVYHERTTSESNRAFYKENMDGYLAGIAKSNQGKNASEQLDPLPINLGINGDRQVTSHTFRNGTYRNQVMTTLKKFKEVEKYVTNTKNAFRHPENQDQFQMAQCAARQLETMLATFDVGHGVDRVDHDAKAATQLSRSINAELFANCLYAMVIQGMGGTVSACCKSSKDRTGLFLLHLDAMQQYYAMTGKLLNFDAPADQHDRVLFVEIMADLYLRNTQQYMANMVTAGTAGLKPPGGIMTEIGLGSLAMDCWPPDLVAAINGKTKRGDLFEAQCEVARLNKISESKIREQGESTNVEAGFTPPK